MRLCKRREGQCDRVSLYRYNAVLFCVEDEFKGSETIQIITGLDSSVTAATDRELVGQSGINRELVQVSW